MKKCAQNHSDESILINTAEFWLDTCKRTAIRKGKHAINLEQVIPDVKCAVFFPNPYLQINGASLDVQYEN